MSHHHHNHINNNYMNTNGSTMTTYTQPTTQLLLPSSHHHSQPLHWAQPTPSFTHQANNISGNAVGSNQYVFYSSSPMTVNHNPTRDSHNLLMKSSANGSSPNMSASSSPCLSDPMRHQEQGRTNNNSSSSASSSTPQRRRTLSSFSSGSSHNKSKSSLGLVFYEHNGIHKRAKKKDVMLPFEKVFTCKDKKNGMAMMMATGSMSPSQTPSCEDPHSVVFMNCSSPTTPSSCSSPNSSPTRLSSAIQNIQQCHSPTIIQQARHQYQQFPQSEINHSMTRIIHSQTTTSPSVHHNVECSVSPTMKTQQPSSLLQRQAVVNVEQPPHLAGSPQIGGSANTSSISVVAKEYHLPSTSTSGGAVSRPYTSCKLTSKPLTTFARSGRTSISIHELLN
ncbi:hypothetical protein FDP41_003602 [Naegleria fowleri]|uniref:Uncharacterized protein n=1 Tax=Naegleria fowleri TaxID=5763 RepID=A0A6A5BV43_NAEFO|nr:uncharacterized protein FDP41_003602 [Naegleria fowleri]KAF0977610.1 hypothetical protein FDP41_003602 [Naegleria fowleri]CAG4715222.1 unnamed protein product [Naegleria fowleri]